MTPVQALLDAVQRRLWRDRFLAAGRQALWTAAAVSATAIALHLLLTPVGPAAWGTVIVLMAVVLGARAAAARPPEAACALWADRHLGGASAYSTLLEQRQRGAASPALDSPALRQLERWVLEQLPQAQRQLAAQRQPARLARPLVAALVCAALAGGVLALFDRPPPSPPAPHPSVSPVTGATPPALGAAGGSAPNGLAGDIAQALRSTAPQALDDQPEAGAGGPSARAGRPDGRAPAKASGGSADGGTAASGASVSAPSSPGTTTAAGASGATGSSTGREAGDGRDLRGQAGLSRLQPLPRAVTRSGAAVAGGQRQADDASAGRYDDQDAAQRPLDGATGGFNAAAATKPPVTASKPLGATQNSYVQAWMKASSSRR